MPHGLNRNILKISCVMFLKHRSISSTEYNGDSVFRCDRTVECKRKKCGLRKQSCKYDLWYKPEKCLSDFRGFLNLKDSRVYDTVIEDGKETRVLNKKETMIASQKQEAVREAFKNWVFEDQERRQDLVAKYNKLFNSTRPREYDGSHLKFPGMTPDIDLRPHQLNAVAHQLYGDNTLLAHCVGAGKDFFEMIAAAMESKRLGLCQRACSLFPII